MDADAVGVAARVTVTDLRRGGRTTPFRALADYVARPAFLVPAILLVLAAIVVPVVWTDHVSTRERAAAVEVERLQVVADLAMHEARLFNAEGERTGLASLLSRLPAIAVSRGRVVYMTDLSGHILAARPVPPYPPRRLQDLFQGGSVSEIAGIDDTVRLALRDGTAALAAFRQVPQGHLVMIQPAQPPFPEDGLPGTSQKVLALVFGAGLLLLGGGCLIHSRRAHRADATCARMHRRLEVSLAHGGCGIWDWDVARGTVTLSASMYALLGYEPRGEQLSLAEFGALVHPPSGSLREFLERIATSPDGSVGRDLRGRTATGQVLWLRAKAEAIDDPVDGSRHVVGIAVDVTAERQRAERDATADARLREAIEAISESFVLWDANDRLVLCNSRFRRLHELQPEHAIPGMTLAQVTEAGRPPIVENEVALRPHARTLESQLSDGRWLQVNERRTGDGGFVSVGADITELKRNEAKLRDSERNLLRTVRELKVSRHDARAQAQRFADLAERHLETSRAKTEFLARMSHELRTPLTAIIGFADMVRSEVLGPFGSGRYSEYIQHIHASGLHLLGAIDDILQMSRIEAGRLDLSPVLTTLAKPVEGALASVGASARAKGLRVETDLGARTILQADPEALQAIVGQLLRNSVRFTPRGGTIRIRARSSADHLNLFVEDSGVGIAPDILPRLGNPFEQIESEYSRSGGSTGLGLAIARALTELHGGRLRIRSQVALGTIVLVRLPLVQQPANDADEPSEPIPARPRLVAAE